MFSTKNRLSCLKQHLFTNTKLNLSSLSSLSPVLAKLTHQTPSNSLLNCNGKNLSTNVLSLEESPNSNYTYLTEIAEKSLQQPDFFNVKKLIKMREMFDSRAYLGHKEGTLNPHMKPYIFGSRLGNLIIDLDQTAHLLQEALNFAAHIAFRNGIILFVNKSASTGHLVEKAAMDCGEYSQCRDWLDGTFTQSTINFGAVTRLPDLLIFLSTHNNVFAEHPAVVEAAKEMIPTIGVVDTNSNPCLITYPVPGNDDSIQSVAYFCKVFGEAITIGKRKRAECLQKPEEEEKVN